MRSTNFFLYLEHGKFHLNTKRVSESERERERQREREREKERTDRARDRQVKWSLKIKMW